MPYPLPLTRTEAYLAYKAGVVQLSDLKPSLAIPRNGIDAWLAYWTGVSTTYPVKNVGKNLFDKNTCVKGALLTDGTIDSVTYGYIRTSNYIPVTAGEKYTVSGTPGGWGVVGFYTSNKVFINRPYSASHVYKVPDGAGYARVVCTEEDLNTCQFEKGSTASGYEAYTSEPLILQEEEAYIAYLSGVINEYPEKCLRRVGSYLRYLISARWGRPDHPLNREELYLSLIKTQFIPSGDPSSDITIEGTCKAPFVDVKMYGDTFQQTYTGKNLFDDNTATGAYIQSNGTVTPNSVWRASQLIKVNPNTSYIWHGEVYGVNQVVWAGYNSSKAFVSGQYAQVNGVSSLVIITGENTEYIRVGYRSDGMRNMQLELGSTATSYEPFVGGQPSPSPDYPQQIQTVTGEQTVTVVGKNLFDKAATTPKTVLNGDGSLGGANDYSTSDFIPVKPSTAYYKSQTSSARFKFYDQNKTPLSSVYDDIPVAGSPQSFTTPNNCYYIRFSFATSVSDSIQIELGSTATAYAPYSKQTLPISLGSIELCKLGTYQDYIYKDGDSWKVHKELGNVTLDSTYYNSRYGTNSYGLTQFLVELGVSDYYDVSGYITMLSNSFTKQTTSFSNTQVQGFLPALDSNSHKLRAWIRISTTTADTTDQFKAWLNTNTPIFYYKLNTATDTTITNTTLITQLEALVSGGAENGTTYIKVKATDPNLPGLLYVEAPKYE